MTRPRLIPCLLLKQGMIVRSQLFRTHQVIGTPMPTVSRFSNWNVDELILLDIGADDYHDLRRDDLQQSYGGSTVLDVLKEVAKVCFMPLAFGGRIRTLEDIRVRLAVGADKCVINSRAIEDPTFLAKAADRFGSQCIVVSIDVLRSDGGSYEVYSHGGKRPTGLDPVSWAHRAEELGAGEIFLNSVDRDGTGRGYDTDLVRNVVDAVSIPVIACGGVGKVEDFAAGIAEGRAHSVAAANFFHFTELSYARAKQACIQAGIPMRAVRLNSHWFPREPLYDRHREDARIEERATRAKAIRQGKPDPGRPATPSQRGRARWCARCTYPLLSAVPMELDNEGICMGCRVAEAKVAISPEEWSRRRELLREILEQYRSRDGNRYDCIIPVSGGKDSYFQTHVIKNEFGLNPLLVTYNGNNWTEAGWYNVHRMKEVFGVDHLFVSPSVEALKKLNRLAFLIMGDMNWHSHVGIMTTPVRAAVQHKVPLLIWGEHGYMDMSGQFSMNDYPEMTYRHRLEHFARGYEWTFFVGRDGFRTGDLLPWQYPSDQELFDLGVRGLYLGNYVHWEANDHGKMVVERYGFRVSDEPFDRTYRRMSNLDDMHENGAHDYLKYVKFGYGRCTDHSSKDIRAGLMDRATAIDLVRKYDPVKPRDIARWLDYVGMTEEEFDSIADTFRDSRVWRRSEKQWIKDDIR